MFEGLFQRMHLLVICGLALLVFGPRKLPELGKGLGESIRGFKSAMKTEEEKPTSMRPVLPATAPRRSNQWDLGQKSSFLWRSELLFSAQNDCRQ